MFRRVALGAQRALGVRLSEKLNFLFARKSLLRKVFKFMRCPICGAPTVWKDNPTRPFCSERCKLIDFSHWADEDYAVPSDEAVPEEVLYGSPQTYADARDANDLTPRRRKE